MADLEPGCKVIISGRFFFHAVEEPGCKVIISGRFFFHAVEEHVTVKDHVVQVLQHPDLNMVRVVSAAYGTVDVPIASVTRWEETWHVADTITVTIHAEPGIVDIDQLRGHLALWTGVEDVQITRDEIRQRIIKGVHTP